MIKIKNRLSKSLFNRYYFIFTVILVLTTTLMGLLIIGISAKYFNDSNRQQLKKNVDQAVGITESAIEKNGRVDISVLNVGFNVISKISDNIVFVSDFDGNVLVCSDGAYHDGIMKHTVSKEILDAAIGGEYSGTGNFEGVYDEDYYTIGVPVSPVGNVQLVVFASNETTDLLYYIYDLVDIIVICAVIAAILSSIAIYFATKKMAKPIKEMVSATKSFSEGDFSIRVPVDGKDEIAQLAGSFNQMADSLAATESVRRNFIANVSHELKTPMMTIGGFIDGILDGTVPKEKTTHYLETVSEEVKRLSRMIKSMLTVSKIEAGDTDLSITVFDINELVCRTVFTFEQRIEKKKLDVVGLESEGIFVKADNDLIHQVIFNLIDNAVKFANEGGCLSFAYKQEDGRVFVAIRNTGAGVSEEDLPRLFDRFYKTDKSRSLDKTGFGLGLYIVQTIINQHKGDLNVRSIEGQFTEFTFSLEAADNKEIPERKTWGQENSGFASTL